MSGNRLDRPGLVVLAAGLGSRFGGLKQLAPVAPNGAAIMDALLHRSAAAGFGYAVIVVAPDAEERVRAHLDAMVDATGASGGPYDRPADFRVELAVQRPRPGRRQPLGTADAVLAARRSIAGPFAVVNADDLYPADAFVRLAGHLRDGPAAEHVLVAFRVARTLSGSRPVSRALIDVDRTGALLAIREGTVVPTAGGLQFETRQLDAGATDRVLDDDQPVSMNIWGFRASVFDALAEAVAAFVAEAREGEVYLPDVVSAMIGSGSTVRVLLSESECIGITHEADLAAVRRALS